MHSERIALFSLLIAALPSAAADLIVTDGFEPHPFEKSLRVKNGDVRLGDGIYRRCATGRTSKTPHFTFEVQGAPGELVLTVDGSALLVGPDGSFACLNKFKPSLTQKEWKPGEWKIFLFGEGDELAGIVKLSQDGRVRAARQAQEANEKAREKDFRAGRFPDAPRIDVGKLETPTLLTATAWDQQVKAPRGFGDSWCENVPGAPTFYLTGEALADVELFLWPARPAGLKVFIAGPLDGAGDARPVKWNCQGSFPLGFKELDDTWAVFVTTTEPSALLSFVVHRPGKAYRPDELWAPRPIPETMALEGRLPGRYYPFWSSTNGGTGATGNRFPDRVEAYFREAPRGLFVSVSVDDGSVVAGEPLLLREYGVKRSVVNRADGSRAEVRTAQLTELPEKGVLPASLLKSPPPLDNVERALAAAGPAEQPLTDRFLELEKELNSCVATWMKKNDRTWGKDYELVYRNTGDTHSQRLFKQADKSCGLAKVEAAGKKLISAGNAARQKQHRAYVAALKERFGR